MIFRSDDPGVDFDRWDAYQMEQLDRLPCCADCGEPIQDDHYYWINDESICPSCLESNYRMETEAYIG